MQIGSESPRCLAGSDEQLAQKDLSNLTSSRHRKAPGPPSGVAQNRILLYRRFAICTPRPTWARVQPENRICPRITPNNAKRDRKSRPAFIAQEPPPTKRCGDAWFFTPFRVFSGLNLGIQVHNPFAPLHRRPNLQFSILNFQFRSTPPAAEFQNGCPSPPRSAPSRVRRGPRQYV